MLVLTIVQSLIIFLQNTHHWNARNIVSFIAETVFLNTLIELSSSFCPHPDEMTPVVSNVELNPYARDNAKICYDFLNGGKCRREKKNGLCYYRHLPDNHIQSIIERIRSGRVGMKEMMI